MIKVEFKEGEIEALHEIMNIAVKTVGIEDNMKTINNVSFFTGKFAEAIKKSKPKEK